MLLLNVQIGNYALNVSAGFSIAPMDEIALSFAPLALFMQGCLTANMQKQVVAMTAESMGPASQIAPEGFIDTEELARRLNCSVGTIQNWRRSGKLPYIKTPGRLILFDWPTVKITLLRMQRGGAA